MSTPNIMLEDVQDYHEFGYFPFETTIDEESLALIYQRMQYLLVNKYVSGEAGPFPSHPCLMEVDMSSVNPTIKECDTISWIEEEEDELNFEEMIEYDEVFSMSPKNSFNIRLNIQSIEKAKPKFVEPY